MPGENIAGPRGVIMSSETLVQRSAPGSDLVLTDPM
jgi:hypothetical protein